MKKKKAHKKDYFGIFFISFSILMFVLFIFVFLWFKNELFMAKDRAALEYLISEEKSSIEINDPYLSVPE
jgi:nitrogen fixation-related uncharacterized protein